MERQLLTTAELCRLYRISRSTVMRWRNEGMPYVGRGHSIRYEPEIVERWIKENPKVSK